MSTMLTIFICLAIIFIIGGLAGGWIKIVEFFIDDNHNGYKGD
jgi:hypothetical protein